MSLSVHAPELPTFWKMRFEAEQELRFNAYYAQEIIPRARMAAVAGSLFMAAFAVLDVFLLAPGVLPYILGLRFLAIGALLLALWLTYRADWEVHTPWLAASAAGVVGLAVVGVLIVAGRSSAPLPYEGILLVLFYFYCCGGLRLREARVVGTGVTAVYLLAEWWGGLPAQEVLARTLFLVAANLIGMVNCGIMELGSRRNFLAQQQLDRFANQDFLTGTLNRRALQEQLERVWRQACREQRPLNVALLDVDYFKRYNDRYGHPAGDVALQKVAQVLLGLTSRTLDLASRYGGEEFVCVWYGNSMEDVHRLLAQLHTSVQALNIAHADSDVAPYLTVSVGMVQVVPQPHHNLTALLELADQTMYEAKHSGRNRSVVRQLESPPVLAAV